MMDKKDISKFLKEYFFTMKERMAYLEHKKTNNESKMFPIVMQAMGRLSSEDEKMIMDYFAIEEQIKQRIHKIDSII